MTDSPQNFADSPDLPDAFVDDPELDALSEILETVRLRGRAITRHTAEPGAPVEVPRGKRVLHIVEQGSVRVRVASESGSCGDITVGSGDMVVLARGDAHTVEALDGPAQWVSGSFQVDEPQAAPLLSVLAPAIVISGEGPGREWLPLSLDLLLVEVIQPRPGAAAMISRILDLLFIHALRAWSTDTAAPGWLTAALDPALAPVLTAIHRSPAAPWSVSDLAALASMSRTTFTDRFTRRLGQPPAAYLADRRLARAATLLRTTPIPIAALAHQVGYDSEAAFSRAFRRRYDVPPLRYRKGDGRLN
ncbi:AraC family transcriptional regulator [Nocardia concava]|uniref:AraC family transcriptional regulator n=1 Tax=Nocardia concava TaxID=257281 RepID=UPI0002FE8FE6|nr:AraC family transcriptional regulator [Nocardia concava]